MNPANEASNAKLLCRTERCFYVRNKHEHQEVFASVFQMS